MMPATKRFPSRDIAAFFADPVGQRAARATKLKERKRIHNAGNGRGGSHHRQGVIDCYFEEEDGIVLIDYKNSYLAKGQRPFRDHGQIQGTDQAVQNGHREGRRQARWGKPGSIFSGAEPSFPYRWTDPGPISQKWKNLLTLPFGTFKSRLALAHIEC